MPKQLGCFFIERDDFLNVCEHYDLLIDEGNDPVFDSEPLKEYMNKWDGQLFIDELNLNKNKTVLEIGVGTGRIAIKTVVFCKMFYGIDISEKTSKRAIGNLTNFENSSIICDDFIKHNFGIKFDVIYSSLTFMHINEKEFAIKKVFDLLNFSGRFVLSIDKNKSTYIDMGNRKLEIFPDNFEDTKKYILSAHFSLLKILETEFAYIFVCEKKTDRT